MCIVFGLSGSTVTEERAHLVKEIAKHVMDPDKTSVPHALMVHSYWKHLVMDLVLRLTIKRAQNAFHAIRTAWPAEVSLVLVHLFCRCSLQFLEVWPSTLVREEWGSIPDYCDDDSACNDDNDVYVYFRFRSAWLYFVPWFLYTWWWDVHRVSLWTVL